ncbi:MAG TPA: diaminopimelate epimerase [Casimicrobiaceae bacterium]|jgi:diaminopimelate epimerase
MRFVKAHALANDFLLVASADAPPASGRPALTRRLCDRQQGIGADGVIFFTPTADGAGMHLLNADGSPSEVSGNGVRCLAAWLARDRNAGVGASLAIRTDAGVKTLRLEAVDGARLTFRAAMGMPEQLQQRTLDVDGTGVDVITLRVGNPQCVVLGEVSEARLRTLASRLAVHPAFPEGTNVELATVDAPDRVRILIWERGVGPTQASGTGACASAVAAIRYGGASPDVQVVSPGGTQRVEWSDEGLFLTGWAEVICDGRWLL